MIRGVPVRAVASTGCERAMSDRDGVVRQRQTFGALTLNETARSTRFSSLMPMACFAFDDGKLTSVYGGLGIPIRSSRAGSSAAVRRLRGERPSCGPRPLNRADAPLQSPSDGLHLASSIWERGSWPRSRERSTASGGGTR